MSFAAKSADDARLADEGVYLTMEFSGLDLSGQQAAAIEIDQCRYGKVSLSQARLRRALVRDAWFDRCDLANLRVRDSSLGRARFTGCRMTGLIFGDRTL